jgi:hypothetical protein
LEKAERALEKLYPKATESREEFRAWAEKVLEKHEVSDLIQIQIDEQTEYHKRYLKAGRPGPKTPYKYAEMSIPEFRIKLSQILFSLPAAHPPMQVVRN